MKLGQLIEEVELFYLPLSLLLLWSAAPVVDFDLFSWCRVLMLLHLVISQVVMPSSNPLWAMLAAHSFTLGLEMRLRATGTVALCQLWVEHQFSPLFRLSLLLNL